MEIGSLAVVGAAGETAAAPKAPEIASASAPSGARFALPEPQTSAESNAAPTVQAAADSPAKAFEALMIAQMVDIMLPYNDAVFGEGAGASVWRSMFVDVLSTQLADDIDLGVARQIEGALNAAAPEKGSL
ncbi:MAG: hypothetical protein AAF940_04375 [Pseudomonadota bacterium]